MIAFLTFTKETVDIPLDSCYTNSSDPKSIIASRACYNHIDSELLLRIAKCESGFNPNARNKHSTASGLFQFIDSTFINQAQAREIEWTDKNDPEIQAELAARMIADGGLGHWNASRNCWDK